MRTAELDYDLPPELIAQHPLPRGESRLMVVHRNTGEIEHKQFNDLLDYLQSGDCLVVNDTRVVARRIQGARPNGLPLEVLLLRPLGETSWQMLASPAKTLRVGSKVELQGKDGTIPGKVVSVHADGSRTVDFGSSQARDALSEAGEAPLPPYIHEHLDDESRYQTVYAAAPGSAAAPTAGLHFTDEMLDKAVRHGISLANVTLHVGVDTFRPVREEELDNHEMHGERYSLSPNASGTISNARRVVAVGTTTVRVLETLSDEDGYLSSAEGETKLFIQPGYQFKCVRALLTNFHLPKSTLLALVSAFAGTDLVREAYATAVKENYRFYSFGDAMLIV